MKSYEIVFVVIVYLFFFQQQVDLRISFRNNVIRLNVRTNTVHVRCTCFRPTWFTRVVGRRVKNKDCWSALDVLSHENYRRNGVFANNSQYRGAFE
jgi:hypothetical protein